MDSKLKTIELILERMNVLYDRMLGILGRERQALIQLDFETLLQEMREKDEIISALRGLDKDRLRLQDQFAIIMGVDPETLSLRSLCEALMEQGGSAVEVAARLMALREKVAGSMAVLREKIESNTVFIEKSVENLQGIAATCSAAMTGKSGPSNKKGSNIYNGKAKFQQEVTPTGTLVEKRL